mgnify:CR=1 FL=1
MSAEYGADQIQITRRIRSSKKKNRECILGVPRLETSSFGV